MQEQIFELVYHTKGGITFEEAYFVMPVHIRNFHYNELVKVLNKEAKAAGSTSNVSPKKTIEPPDFVRRGN